MPTPIAVQTNTATAVADGGTVEKVILTTSPVTTVHAEDVVTIIVQADWTIGTSGTALQLRVRRGASAAGTVVATGDAVTVVAADKYHLGLTAKDSPGLVDGAVYSVTATGTANTVDGTADVISAVTIVASTAD